MSRRDSLPQERTAALLSEARGCLARGRPKEARRIVERALAADPESFAARYLQGVSLCQLGRFEDAVPALQSALDVDALSADANCAMGHALQSLGRQEESLAYFDAAIGSDRGFADAHYNKGVALRALGRNEESIACFDAALTINPVDAQAWNNKANALHDLGRYEEALACYGRALQLEPRFASALANRGATLERLGRLADALSDYDRALAIEPAAADVVYARAQALLFLKQFEQAATGFRELLRRHPAHPYAAGRYASALAHCCDWSTYPALRKTLVEGVARRDRVSTPFAFLGVADSPAAQRTCAETFVADEYPPRSPALWTGGRNDHDRIRLAYLSADFHEHPTSFLLAGLFERHDRSRFETTAVSLGAPMPASRMQQRLRSAFERFIDVAGMSDLAIARRLRELEVDVLVDLGGGTQDSGIGVLAWRPAPIQVNYLGYPGTMGAPYVDYILADRFVVPDDQGQFYAEKIVRLPDCFQANDSMRQVAESTPSRAEMELPEAGPVFCCFNSTYKITPALFDAWMRILLKVPGSVLWLMGDQQCVVSNLRREAASRGIDARRLVFAQRAPYEQYLARYRLADLFLDTLPFNAGATASDALWAGLPVVTCPGTAFAARMAGSLLNALGVPELVAPSLEEYEALAVQLATDRARLAAIRQKVAANRAATPLFDTDRFRRNIERAYGEMWARHRDGRPPETFDVAPE